MYVSPCQKKSPTRGGWDRSRENLSGSSGLGADAHDFPVLAVLPKRHDAGDLGKQGVVPADTDVPARFKASPPLTDQDAAGGHQLAAETLHSQPLRIAVPSVAGTP